MRSLPLLEGFLPMSTLPGDFRGSAFAESQGAIVPPAGVNTDDHVREFELAAIRLKVSVPSAAELSNLYRQVLETTADLFPGKLRVSVKNDPEISDDIYFLFAVDVTGSIDDIAARTDEWHGRVCRLPNKFSGLFRLSVRVR